VLADLEAEDLKLGFHAFGHVEVAKLACWHEVRHPVSGLGPNLGEQVKGRRASLFHRGLPGQHPNPRQQVSPGRTGRGRDLVPGCLLSARRTESAWGRSRGIWLHPEIRWLW
jgi:hypothetical protein